MTAADRTPNNTRRSNTVTNTTYGLEARYDVKKINDPDGKHDDCRYFVLDPQHDPIARKALDAYGQEARRRGYGALADDIERWLDSAEPHGDR